MTLEYKKAIRRLKLSEETGEHEVSVNRVTAGGFGNHWHDFYEIEIIADGEGEYTFNGVKYYRKKGDMCLLTPVDFHEMRGNGMRLKLISIEVGTAWISEAMSKMMCSPEFEKFHSTTEEELESVLSAVELLEREYKNDGPCIGQLVEYLLGRFLLRNEQNAKPDTGKDSVSGIMKAIAYMEQHFCETISLDTLSQISGYHPTYFSKMFTKVTGENYIDRLTTLRINYAKMLLKRGVSVGEACTDSGFSSMSHFVSVFKKRCGMTPSAYRSSE